MMFNLCGLINIYEPLFIRKTGRNGVSRLKDGDIWGFVASQTQSRLLPELFGVILLNLGSLFDKLHVSIQQIQSALSVSFNHVMLVLQTQTQRVICLFLVCRTVWSQNRCGALFSVCSSFPMCTHLN